MSTSLEMDFFHVIVVLPILPMDKFSPSNFTGR
ncbi:hypothetical protein T08_4695 [Trichinella sp. T8]|nr:hypothetical protein T08_4695 [Trichinella sp. T8]